MCDFINSETKTTENIYIRENDSPLRSIVTRKQKLKRYEHARLSDPGYFKKQEEQCEHCGSSELVHDTKTSDFICTCCGAVLDYGLYESAPRVSADVHRLFLLDGAHRTDKGSCDVFSSGYKRYFHFNEVLAVIRIDDPWIPNLDMNEFRIHFKNKNKDNIKKQDIYLACYEIDSKYKIKRFQKKYSEKWIQIVFRLTGRRPPLIDDYMTSVIREDFKKMISKWEILCKFLPRKKNVKVTRVQWPSYSETIYRIIKNRFPSVSRNFKPWITRLSKKKKKEMKNFFNMAISYA